MHAVPEYKYPVSVTGYVKNIGMLLLNVAYVAKQIQIRVTHTSDTRDAHF